MSGGTAYYWDWGRRLDWGYFSKPPFIAWMMAGAGWLGGNTEFGLRMWSVLFGSGSILFAFLLGRRLYGEKTGFFAGALVAAMPGAVLLNLLLTIDAPLVFFWSAALYLFHRLDRGGEGLWRRLAVAAGLTLVLGLGH
jgi:4-amino-4-deoxy-L-arabinose transferase-like glycosyltransferase